jgi:ubiquinol-cytochrome c reductase iron-sulfur subunit
VSTIEEADGSRRDFLLITAGALAAVGTAGTLWPFVAQMAPDASTIAAGAPVDVDISAVAAGQVAKIVWRGKPIFIRHMTSAELDGEKKVDPASLQDPAPVSDRVKSGHETFALMFANCTHLGCVPNKNDHAAGWLCPCHGSIFDAVGRRRAGPAPTNLPIPPYAFLSDTKIRIG